MWKGFRQHHYALHRRLGYLALAATALGSLSAAPYALSYLLSACLPQTVSPISFLSVRYTQSNAFVLLVYHMAVAATILKSAAYIGMIT